MSGRPTGMPTQDGESPSAEHLLPVVDELRILLHESAIYHRDIPALAEVYRDSLVPLRSLSTRLSKASDRYVVAVVGLTNVGKSTFLNALLGSDLAPRRNGPCTSSVIEFHYGESLCVSANRHHSIHRFQRVCSAPSEVHKCLESIADDDGELAGADIRRVKVEAPVAMLRSGLIIADTPGFGAAQIGEKEGTHEAALKSYLSGQVSKVFWVVLAEQGIGKIEKTFYNEFFADVCDDVIVTGCEGWDTTDRNRFKRRFAGMFNKPMLRFHFISGLQGLVARNDNDTQGLENSGIRALEDRIVELASASGRIRSVQTSLLEFAGDLRQWISDFRTEDHAKIGECWRPDSWSRWESSCPGNRVKDEVMNVLAQ